MQAGAERDRATHPKNATALEAWIGRLTRSSNVLPDGKSLDLLKDAMIAAIAKVNGLTIATRNTSGFAQFNVP